MPETPARRQPVLLWWDWPEDHLPPLKSKQFRACFGDDWIKTDA